MCSGWCNDEVTPRHARFNNENNYGDFCKFHTKMSIESHVCKRFVLAATLRKQYIYYCVIQMYILRHQLS